VKRPGSESDCSYLEPSSRIRGAFTSCYQYIRLILTTVIVNRESQRFLKYVSYCCYYTWGSVRLSPLGTPVATGPIVPAPDVVDDDDEKELVD
jgi:hypothetical protein